MPQRLNSFELCKLNGYSFQYSVISENSNTMRVRAFFPFIVWTIVFMVSLLLCINTWLLRNYFQVEAETNHPHSRRKICYYVYKWPFRCISERGWEKLVITQVLELTKILQQRVFHKEFSLVDEGRKKIVHFKGKLIFPNLHTSLHVIACFSQLHVIIKTRCNYQLNWYIIGKCTLRLHSHEHRNYN